jgi:hypothetical protein
MRVWHFLGSLAVALALGWIASCGGSFDEDPDQGMRNVAFTPVPTPTRPPNLCGNGVVDEMFGEECDTGAGAPQTCGGAESCVCCVCLADGETLGVKPFSISRPNGSAFFNSFIQGDVSPPTSVWLPGPLMIEAGRPDPTEPPENPNMACSAALSLSQDAVYGFNVLDGSLVCVRLQAEGSTGFIDCDGGTPHDVQASIDSHGDGPAGPWIVEGGLGEPAEAGALTLDIEELVNIRIPVGGSATEICPTLDYDEPDNPEQVEQYSIDPPTDIVVERTIFTTEILHGEVLNPKGGGPTISISVEGKNLGCANWTEEDGPGTIVGPISGLDNPIAGDTINAFILSDRENP